jgi:hypothetical protein
MVRFWQDTPAGNWSSWSNRSAMLRRLSSVTYQTQYEVIALNYNADRWKLNYYTNGSFEPGRPYLIAQFVSALGSHWHSEAPIWVAAVHLNHYFLTSFNPPHVDTVIPGCASSPQLLQTCVSLRSSLSLCLMRAG